MMPQVVTICHAGFHVTATAVVPVSPSAHVYHIRVIIISIGTLDWLRFIYLRFEMPVQILMTRRSRYGLGCEEAAADDRVHGMVDQAMRQAGLRSAAQAGVGGYRGEDGRWVAALIPTPFPNVFSVVSGQPAGCAACILADIIIVVRATVRPACARRCYLVNLGRLCPPDLAPVSAQLPPSLRGLSCFLRPELVGARARSPPPPPPRPAGDVGAVIGVLV
jgi:hypothetical protein